MRSPDQYVHVDSYQAQHTHQLLILTLSCREHLHTLAAALTDSGGSLFISTAIGFAHGSAKPPRSGDSLRREKLGASIGLAMIFTPLA